jgi:hypothetical protein
MPPPGIPVAMRLDLGSVLCRLGPLPYWPMNMPGGGVWEPRGSEVPWPGLVNPARRGWGGWPVIAGVARLKEVGPENVRV